MDEGDGEPAKGGGKEGDKLWTMGHAIDKIVWARKCITGYD